MTILDYGCGNGWLGIDLITEGAAEVVGIDISGELIRKARELAEQKRVTDRIQFIKMAGEDLTLPENYFDLVLGSAILHHTDLDSAMQNIFKVLKPRGRALFIEPLNQNIFLKMWRSMTPRRRSPTERALLSKDLQLIQKIFPGARYHFYKLFAIFTTGLALAFPDNKYLKIADAVFENVDQRLLAVFPALGKYCAVVVLELTKNKA